MSSKRRPMLTKSRLICAWYVKKKLQGSRKWLREADVFKLSWIAWAMSFVITEENFSWNRRKNTSSSASKKMKKHVFKTLTGGIGIKRSIKHLTKCWLLKFANAECIMKLRNALTSLSSTSRTCVLKKIKLKMNKPAKQWRKSYSLTNNTWRIKWVIQVPVLK